MTSIPEDLRYTAEHEWVRVDGEDLVVGITDHAQDLMGELVFIDLPPEGSSFDGGAEFGEVESSKSVSDLFLPVAGEIVAVNEALEGRPELVNEDPYGDGWLVRIRPATASDVDGLMTAAAYGDLVG